GPFENQGFEKAFNKDARITFHGCHVGEGADGEWFLIRIGQIFLKNGGGLVQGNTGYGAGHGWVTAKVTPGGEGSLSGHSYLDLKAIEDRIGKVALSVDAREARKPPFNIQSAREALATAVTYVPPPANGSYKHLFGACSRLDEAERQLKIVEDLMRQPRNKL